MLELVWHSWLTGLKFALKNQFATNARLLFVQQPQENSWVNVLVTIFLYLFFFVGMHL